MRLAADINLVRLKDAWTKAIASFDILRTSFHFLSGQGVWTQAVHSTPSVQWWEHPYIADAQLTEALNPFIKMSEENEMFVRPPISLNLVQAASSEGTPQLVLVLHHALYDGLSIAGLFQSVEQLYRGVELLKLPQYHQILPRIALQEKNGTPFWVDRLRDLHHAPLPRLAAASEEAPTVHLVSHTVELTDAEIRRTCSDAEVTAQCIGQAAFAKLLAVMTQRRDVVFGRVVSGRDVPGAEEVIGPLLVRVKPTFSYALTYMCFRTLCRAASTCTTKSRTRLSSSECTKPT